MVQKSDSSHVYHREVGPTERTSLSVLAELIPPNASVLDLGCGSGALGRHLRNMGSPSPIDGVTISEDEANMARQSYRRVEVADLDSSNWDRLFRDNSYDCIICADVLEHLKHPEKVLDTCRTLLNDGGCLLISVPNAAYCGLIAELMSGDFVYRDEGLLDRTHLRFFTRRSLLRFLGSSRWVCAPLHTIQRSLHQSEFRVPFDCLPKPVARHLLTAPDALTYQYIAVCHPSNDVSDLSLLEPPNAENAEARFSTELYFGKQGQYSEACKLQASGVIGQENQIIEFFWDAAPDITGLRLDLTDRPGFLHLCEVSLADSSGQQLWLWDIENDKRNTQRPLTCEGLLFPVDRLLQGPTLMMVFGDDPWLELPIPSQLLEKISEGGSLRVRMGWPMSADYVAVLPEIRRLNAEKLESKRALHESQQSLSEQTSRLRAEEARVESLAEDKRSLQQLNLKLQGELDGLINHLQTIENSTVFRATRPLVHAKMWIEKTVGKSKADSAPLLNRERSFERSPTDSNPEVDIIVPIYKGLAETRRCVHSVLRSSVRARWRLVLINDASPEPEVTAWLRSIVDQASDGRQILLLENDTNLGFVATVNKGMALCDDRDVLLLNSDTEVANDWLDRLAAAAHSASDVGTVTPFSNNATIFSYPCFCEPNELPHGSSTESLDRLFAAQNAARVIDVPTAMGFCMYIRRDCLKQVGLFDVETFGLGYGEENDFCLRASAQGWRHLHALDTFVRHAGGVSFGSSKRGRELVAMEKLRSLYPKYEGQVHKFIMQDPARQARVRVDIARLADPVRPVVLAVLHDRGGGTQRHVHELAAHLRDRAVFLTLKPAGGGEVSLGIAGDNEAMQLAFQLPEAMPDLVKSLEQLGVKHVHFHHLIGLPPSVLELPARLNVRYDFTAHDYYTYCPQITLTDRSNKYCQEKGLHQCRQCLRESPAPGGVNIETWRQRNTAFATEARYVLIPSQDAAKRLRRYLPAAKIRVVAHTDLSHEHLRPAASPERWSDARTLRVVVIGALSAIKGADLLEEIGVLAAEQDSPVEFHLLGYGYRHLHTQPRCKLTVHGEYKDADLPQLLDWLKPDLAWFPAQWPETYSYTLSACLQAGLPIVAPSLGAFAERLESRAWTWICDWDRSAQDWLTFLLEIRAQHFMTGAPPSPSISSIAANAGNPPTTNWSYHHEYLADIGWAVTPAHLDDELIWKHSNNARKGALSTSRLKRMALGAVVSLRSARGFSGLAKRIPLRWQTRIKTWLRS